MGLFTDDRTREEKRTHWVLVGGRDRFMSGWGGPKRVDSWAFWACRPEDAGVVAERLKWRADIVKVAIHEDPRTRDTRPEGVSRADHCHIYVVRDGHPYLSGRETPLLRKRIASSRAGWRR